MVLALTTTKANNWW